MVSGRAKAKVEFSDEKPAQIAKLVSEYSRTLNAEGTEDVVCNHRSAV